MSKWLSPSDRGFVHQCSGTYSAERRQASRIDIEMTEHCSLYMLAHASWPAVKIGIS